MTPDIPEGWSISPLDQFLAGIDAGWSPQCAGHPALPGEWGVLKVSAVSSGVFLPTENKALPPNLVPRPDIEVRNGDLLLARASGVLELVGRTAFVRSAPARLLLSDKILRLRPKEGQADGSFLHAVLSFAPVRDALANVTGGSHMRNVSQRMLRELLVTIPPLPEQRKIAAILSSLDAAIEATEAVIEQLQVVKKAMMPEFLTRGIPGSHKKFKTTEIGEVPEEWELRRLGEVTEQRRTQVVVDRHATYREIGVRSHAKGVFHKAPVSGEDLGNKRVFWLEPGCLVVNIVFAWEGAVAATSEKEAGMIASHRFPMFQPDPRILSLQYLRLLLQTKRGIEILGSLSPGGAGRNKTLNQGALQRLDIPIPPLAEQEAIASSIVSVEDRLVVENDALVAARACKNALLSVLLTGEVRVKPDEAAA